MFKLIKKDLITTILSNKKANLQYLLILFILYAFLNPISYFLANTIISYMIISYTFTYDEQSNSREFILSMPINKEDIVYAKYIMSFILIVLTSTFNALITWIIGGIFYRGPVLNDLLISNSVFLIVISLVLPIIFKFGYQKSKFYVGGIYVLVTLFLCGIFSTISSLVYNTVGNVFKSFVFEFSGFMSNLYEYIVNNINITYVNLYTINLIAILIYILSLYISLNIVKSKKINNRKFGLVALAIFILFGGYILINKASYKERIYAEDYEYTDYMDVEISTEGYREVEEGLLIKVKIENLSRYTCRFNELNLHFEKEYTYENGSLTSNNYISISPYEMDINNSKIIKDGIEPYGVEYVTFLQPKGLVIENEFFDLGNVVVNFDINYTVNIPVLNTYTTMGSCSSSYTVEYMNFMNKQ